MNVPTKKVATNVTVTMAFTKRRESVLILTRFDITCYLAMPIKSIWRDIVPSRGRARIKLKMFLGEMQLYWGLVWRHFPLHCDF